MESKIFTGTIESLTFEGKGVVKHDGKVYFVENSWPGDVATFEVIKEKKSYGYAKLLEITKASTQRKEKLECEFQRNCGGCAWMPFNYPSQIEEKKNILKSLLKRARLSEFEPYIKDIITSPQFAYKNRIQIHHNKNELGFMKKGSREITPINHCLVANEEINKLIKFCSSHLKNLPPKVHLDDRMNEEDVLNQKNFGFRQGNSFINNKMNEYLKQNLTHYERGIELFCGQGNFTSLLLKHANNLWAVDSFTGELAKSKSEKLKVTQMNLYENFQISHSFLNSSFLFLDPPRSGFSDLARVTKMLKGLNEIIYVSCNPASAFEDIKEVVQEGSFEIKEIVPFDAYPHTPHIELIIKLSKPTT